MVRLLFGSWIKVLLWIIILICLFVPYGIWAAVEFLLIGPCVSIWGLLAWHGKKIESTKSQKQLKSIIAAAHTAGETSGKEKWKTSGGDGDINYKLATKNPERAPVISVVFGNNSSGNTTVHVSMSECYMGHRFELLGGISEGLALFLGMMPPIAFWVSGGSRALSKVNQIANAIKIQEPVTAPDHAQDASSLSEPTQNPACVVASSTLPRPMLSSPTSGSVRSTVRAMVSGRVKDIIANQLNIESDMVLERNKLIDDLGADDLDLAEIMMGISTEFEILISGEEQNMLQSKSYIVGSIVKFVTNEKIATDHASAAMETSLQLASVPVPVDDNINKASATIGSLADLEKLLRDNNISYSAYEFDVDNYIQSYRDLKSPYLIIETTQLFTNAGCAMTYLQKDWRANPFALDNLGNIDISISDEGIICISTMLPENRLVSGGAEGQAMQQIERLIAQGREGMMTDIGCYQFGSDIVIELPIELTVQKSPADLADDAFAIIQLFALEVHRIFGSLVTPSGAPKAPPKSNVKYTPDAQDANGGYFVYSPTGYLWWIVDKDFKFQSIVGETVWKEHQDAEADGLPLTETDYDNLYRYENGMLLNRDGKVMGRYYTERYDIVPQFQNAQALFNTFQSDNMLTGFQEMCDLYLLFPENQTLFEQISDIAEQSKSVGASGSVEDQITARACLMLLDKVKQKCPAEDKIRRI